MRQLVTHDRAGERILEGLVADAQQRSGGRGRARQIHLFKNNTDSAGNSYGCHENYLVRRQGDFGRLAGRADPVPHHAPGDDRARARCCPTPRGAVYCLSQRADHIWEAVSSATTRSRPIINTRDEPHADAEQYRRLHVIVGDSSMAEPTTMLKVASTDLLLRLVEAGVPVRDLTLENPIRAIREISHDMTGTQLDDAGERPDRDRGARSRRSTWSGSASFVGAELDPLRADSLRPGPVGARRCGRCAPGTCRSSTGSSTGRSSTG